MISLLDFFEQGHALGHDRFLPSDGSDHFAGFGFQSDQIGRHAQQTADSLADLLLIVRKFRLLDKHGAIEVRDPETLLGDLVPGGHEHLARVAPLVARVGIGKQLADVAQSSGTQQSVGNGVQQNVGIAVAHGLKVEGNVDPAQPQRPPRRQPVRVVPNPYACA